MILDAGGLGLAQRGEQVLARMPGRLRDHAGAETHAAVMEMRTGAHQLVPAAISELAELRAEMSRTLARMGLRSASAGTYPLALTRAVELSQGSRYRMIARTMRALAHRPPTMALHVHVGVPDPEGAIRVLNGLRSAVPPLIALAANSPFCEGRDGGFASERTAIFQAFPRTGLPRAFDDYEEYVRAVDALIDSGALPDPTFLWWDLRLQPALGTVEVRVMDTQVEVADTAAIVALVQSLAQMALEGDAEPPAAPEVLAENRFLAARDGMQARLIGARSGALEPVGVTIDALIRRCRPHAERLGCAEELELAHGLAAANGACRQRRRARMHGGLGGVLEMLARRFSPPMEVRAGRPGASLPAWAAPAVQAKPA